MPQSEVLCLATLVLLFLFIQQQQNQLMAFYILAERWINECSALLAVASNRAQRRRLRRSRRAPYPWVLPRPNESWFEQHYYDAGNSEEFFRHQLRVRRETFNTIITILGPKLVRKNSRFRACLPPEKVLAVGLFRLAHGTSYKTIASSFNVGKSTAVEAVQDVVQGLCELRADHIRFPETLAEVNETTRTFDGVCSLPNILGVIGSFHVGIKAPQESSAEYLRINQQYDFIHQAVVNGEKLFTDFACGFPGSMTNSDVLKNSAIFTRVQRGEIVNAPALHIRGHVVLPYLVGDSSYPLFPFLMTPYPEDTTHPDEATFNKELASARVQVDHAFNMLRNRWRTLQKRCDSNITFAETTVLACAVLHNICIRKGDVWLEDEHVDDHSCVENRCADVTRSGKCIRDVLKEFVNYPFHSGQYQV